ncbi:oligosaccharide flippase family protein [Psychromonas sp. 14N.309.X.WAT.B.A12]|uniref:oligosaccharide flippase family protein n=1 Tax=Psychromonas sp. 14N.309.X.WAT.B.A12 TaxID=2998322 RepID=UPI0025AF208C|nr:oligosaccharide flippase family protein [Psychromonas sp. 14N.309.X.WAT.B.A12]MDN2664231.1 oligosaccharide flippase family protein [Psychromonas sp. 14N.309.X.WAT.B.A12]
MNQQKSVMSGIGTMAALTISSKLVRLLILMITARFLTPEDFGVVAAFTMVFAFAYLLSEMGIVRTIIQRPEINIKHIGSALVLSVFLSLIVASSLILFNDYISKILTIDDISLPLGISSMMFLLLGVSNVCSALLQRDGEVVFIGKVQAFGTIFGNVFVTIPLLYFDIGYWAIIIGLWASELISVVFILCKNFKKLHFKVYRKEAIEIAQYSSAFFLNNTLTLLSQQIDVAIVSRFMGSVALGNYSRAMQLVEFPNQVYWLVVDRVVFPVMSTMKSEKEKLTLFFLESISLLSLGLTIGTVVLIFGSHEIVSLMMGEQWGVVGDILQVLAACIIFRALTAFMDSFLAAYGLVKILTIKQIFSLFLLVISIWSALDYGVIGIAYSVVIASALRFFLTLLLIVLNTYVKTSLLIKAFIPSLFSSLIIIFIYFLLSQLPIFIGLFGVIVAVIFLLSTYILFPMKVLMSESGVNFLSIIKKRYFKS